MVFKNQIKICLKLLIKFNVSTIHSKLVLLQLTLLIKLKTKFVKFNWMWVGSKTKLSGKLKSYYHYFGFII